MRRPLNSSPASAGSMKLDQEMRECRFAYLSVLSNTTEDITSRKELTLEYSCIAKLWNELPVSWSNKETLQFSGRNPSQSTIDNYWKRSTTSISYSEFCDIMRKEKQCTKYDMLSAFKKMDINGDGYISFKELRKALTMYGEKMTESEVHDILEGVDDKGDERLDYEEFCEVLVSTSESCKEFNQRKLKEETTPRDRRPRSLLQNKSPRTQGKVFKAPKNLKQWNVEAMKGFVVMEDDGTFSSHSYLLNVPSTTTVWFTVRGNYRVDHPVDLWLFVVKRDSRQLMVFTQGIVGEKSCGQAELSPGQYTILLFTTGCRIPARNLKASRVVELIKTVNDEIQLTKRCRDTLTEIFNHCDLDGNGYLNRQEFDLFQMRTSGESCDDDAWLVMVENFETKNRHEITLKGFLDLNLMEARDAEGDPNDMWITFNNMGYNKSLEPDQVAFFVLEVYARDCEPGLEAQKMSSHGEPLQQTLTQAIVDNSTTHNIKRMRDLILHRYEDETRVSFAVENKSRQQVLVRLNCRKSENCMSHRGNLNCVIKVGPKSTEIGHHLIPLDSSKPWSVSCDDSVED